MAGGHSSQATACDVTVGGADGPSVPSENPNQRRGEHFGRYLLLEELGAGGMGVVYQAFDPDLNRRVALKIIRTQATSESGNSRSASDQRSRMVREARALARLSHPNIVAVFDAGQRGGEIFLAMELVRGQTLREWLAATQPDWPAILNVFIGLARGLSEVHRGDLIHRDIKPDNIIVGEDGIAKILDFGLVHTREDPPQRLTLVSESHSGDSRDMPSSELTQAGTILGTPAYMSPEQHEASEITAQSDQFSLSVTLYEAMYGVRPFSGVQRLRLFAAIMRGRLERPLIRRKLPTWLHEIIIRGLRAQPGLRFASMDAWLEAVDEGRHRRSRSLRRALVASTCLGLGLASSALWADDSQRCEGPRRAAAQVWHASTQQRIARAFAETGAPRASRAWNESRALIDRYLGEWVEHSRTRCREQSSALALGHGIDADDELRNACYEARLEAVRTLAELWSDPDLTMVEKSTSSARNLPAIGDCADPSELRDLDLLNASPERKAEIHDLRQQLNRAALLDGTGQRRASLELAQRVSQRADQLGLGSVAAAAYWRLGQQQTNFADPHAVIASNRRALTLAERSGDDVTAARAVKTLILAHSVFFRDFDAAEAMIDYAGARVLRAGDAPGLRSQWLRAAAVTAAMQGQFERADDFITESITLAQQMGDTDRVAQLYDIHATILQALGRPEAAQQRYHSAIETQQTRLGPLHPSLHLLHSNYAQLLGQLGEVQSSLENFTQAIEIYLDAFGPEHRRLPMAYNYRAEHLVAMGEPDRAQADFERAAEIAGLHASTRTSTRALTAQLRAAHMSALMGDRAGARMQSEQIEQQISASLSPRDKAGLVSVRVRLALALGEHERAQKLSRELRTQPLETLGPAAARALGESALSTGDWARARTDFERCLAAIAQSNRFIDNVPQPCAHGLALAHLGLGDLEPARALLEDQLQRHTAVHGIGHFTSWATHRAQARVARSTRGGDTTGAVRALQRALAAHTRGRGDPRDRAGMYIELLELLEASAVAVTEDGPDRARVATDALQWAETLTRSGNEGLSDELVAKLRQAAKLP